MIKRSTIDQFNNYSRHNISLLIEAYGQWINDYMDKGWDAYLFTFMFNHIPGPPQEKMRQMRIYLARWYGRLATRTVRNPRSPKQKGLLPKAILLPDLPVRKHSKQTLMQVTINDGLHLHGLVLATRLGTRIRETLDVHMKENEAVYFTRELHHINVKPITHNAEFVADYGLKSVKPSFSLDDILIFPRTVSELPFKIPASSQGPARAAGERPTYDFQRK